VVDPEGGGGRGRRERGGGKGREGGGGGGSCLIYYMKIYIGYLMQSLFWPISFSSTLACVLGEERDQSPPVRLASHAVKENKIERF
jgi:hypothetical protein